MFYFLPQQCQKDIGEALPLNSQLIKPVQRIVKYRMLLEARVSVMSYHI